MSEEERLELFLVRLAQALRTLLELAALPGSLSDHQAEREEKDDGQREQQ